MPNYNYEDFMKQTGLTDKALGREYKCPVCGRKYWSAWGHARRHAEDEIGRFKVVYDRIPMGERKNPIYVGDGKAYSWDDVLNEVKRGTDLAKQMLDKLTEMRIIFSLSDYHRIVKSGISWRR